VLSIWHHIFVLLGFDANEKGGETIPWKVDPNLVPIGKGIQVENFKVNKHLRVGHLGRLAV
jgi:hypothetical protein